MLKPKPNIDKLLPTAHGGIDYAELKKLGISPEKVLDFSVSTNPFGPPPGIEKAISNASVEHYPDSESTELKQALADKLEVEKDKILIGSGSTELIRLITSAYLSSSDRVIIPQPTYGEYEIACNLVGAKIIKQAAVEKNNFKLNSAETVNLIKKHLPKGVFLCNPNNPTGQYLAKEELKQILSAAKDVLVILDEAYVAFTENAWASLALLSYDNLVILRSMTKDYALAGLRLGYLLANEEVISTLKKVRPPWNVSSVAQKAGVYATNADDYIAECGRKITESKRFLIKELSAMGFKLLPSKTNFFLVKVGNAKDFRQKLLTKSTLVRDCASFGLAEYIRIAPRDLSECKKLINVIKGVRQHG